MTTVQHAASPGRLAGSAGRDVGSAVVGAATALLDGYRPGGTAFFASPTLTLLAEGRRQWVAHGAEPLADRVARALAAAALDRGTTVHQDRGTAVGRDQGASGSALPPGRTPRTPIVVGAVPFDHRSPAWLAVPDAVRWGPPLADDPLSALAPPPPAATAWQQRPVPEPAGYLAGVGEAVRRIRAGRLTKVVLARTLELTAPESVDLPGMVRRLAHRDVAGYTFAVPAAEGHTLLGASPELLVSRRGRAVVANPLAGSTPRGTDLADDVRRAAALLESEKDLAEHALVVDQVRAALAPLCATLEVPDRPTLARTAALWHLSTTITGELAAPAASALDVATALHPTPAVCGTPTADARAAIADLEPFDRDLYAGMVGWQDAAGDGEWVVTIRCAEVGERSLRLYAGAGIVAGSRPAAELDETAAKLRTFLAAVGAVER